eukprot:TRINITY_DN100424_c0_g1_i1.p1 TRINITY_DN100424_c0_g1~~TRINITY_DN100424_c0_g1_i1.p1  ORF type:complete len:364 (+),score=56.05 TRINITY_DN100424_c0_g1_i1:81-1172(+)
MAVTMADAPCEAAAAGKDSQDGVAAGSPDESRQQGGRKRPRLDEEDDLELSSRTLAGMEAEVTKVCGLEIKMLRRSADYFAACAGDLPIKSTGLVLWECGLLLADYLGYARWLEAVARNQRPWWEIHAPAAVIPSRFWHGKRVLELGGGCGLVSVMLACLGAHVLCTDGDRAALATAKRNALEARKRYRKNWGSVDFCLLSWGHEESAKFLAESKGPFDYIVGSDLLYGDKAPPQPLVDTLRSLTSVSSCEHAEIVIVAKNRCANELEGFQRAAEALDRWDVALADHEDLLAGYDGRSTFYGSDAPLYGVFRLTRKTAPEHHAASETESCAAQKVVSVDAAGPIAGREPPAKLRRLLQGCAIQ